MPVGTKKKEDLSRRVNTIVRESNVMHFCRSGEAKRSIHVDPRGTHKLLKRRPSTAPSMVSCIYCNYTASCIAIITHPTSQAKPNDAYSCLSRSSMAAEKSSHDQVSSASS